MKSMIVMFFLFLPHFSHADQLPSGHRIDCYHATGYEMSPSTKCGANDDQDRCTNQGRNLSDIALYENQKLRANFEENGVEKIRLVLNTIGSNYNPDSQIKNIQNISATLNVGEKVYTNGRDQFPGRLHIEFAGDESNQGHYSDVAVTCKNGDTAVWICTGPMKNGTSVYNLVLY